MNSHTRWSEELGYSSQERPPGWAIEIDDHLKQPPARAAVSSAPYRMDFVPNRLLILFYETFKPELVSLGQFEYPRAMGISDLKRDFLLRLLKRKSRRNGIDEDRGFRASEAVNLKDLITAMESEAERIRSCYGLGIDHFPADYIAQVMVVDGCFIIELLHQHYKFQRQVELEIDEIIDPIFRDWRLQILRHDLIKLENQLPFFVLHKLFGMVTSPGEPTLQTLVHCFFDPLMPTVYRDSPVAPAVEECDHLVHILCTHLRYRSRVGASRADFLQEGYEVCIVQEHPDLEYAAVQEYSSKPPSRHYFSPTPAFSASKILETGINISKRRGGSGLLDISFRRKVLKIPPLRIDDNTVHLLLNILAYEQSRGDIPQLFTKYFSFLNSLIESEDDLAVLRERGIVDHGLRSDKGVIDLLRKVHKVVYLEFLQDEIDNINCHCRNYYSRKQEYYMSKFRGWYKNLVSTYFSSPWTVLSLVAAVVLLVMTGVQTFYTVYSYYKP